jgi:predicted amidohydrolase YtcJ
VLLRVGEPAVERRHGVFSRSADEALRSYTINNAYAAFEEGSKGSLKAGKLADVTVLSKDILTVPEDEIQSAKVDYTIVGGKVMYERTPR